MKHLSIEQLKAEEAEVGRQMSELKRHIDGLRFTQQSGLRLRLKIERVKLSGLKHAIHQEIIKRETEQEYGLIWDQIVGSRRGYEQGRVSRS